MTESPEELPEAPEAPAAVPPPNPEQLDPEEAPE